VGAESTFSTDLKELDALVGELEPLIDKVWRCCESAGARGRTVTLKAKFADFEIITRSPSVPSAVVNRPDLAALAIGLLKDNMPLPKPVRLLGVSLSSLHVGDDAEPQLDFGL
jgi:DNA polymerase IV